jgi:PAS domain S-box-containing protein
MSEPDMPGADVPWSELPIFVLRVGKDRRIRWVSRTAPGLRAEDVVGAGVLNFVDPAYHEVASRTLDEVFASGIPGYYETETRSPAGDMGVYEVRVLPRASGEEVLLIATDITAHRQRVRAVAASLNQLEVAVEGTGMGTWSWDLTTGEVVWDARMRQICGVDEPVALSEFLTTLVHEDDREIVQEDGEYLFRTGVWRSRPHRIVRPDGTERWVLTLGRPVLADDRIVRIDGGTLDVTERRMIEESLQRAQRMDALGQLTAGLAHNFNNLLAVILPALESLEEVVPPDRATPLQDAQLAGERARELVQQLMAFAGRRPGRQRSRLAVAALLEDAIGLCRQTFSRSLTLELRLPPEPLYVAADVAELEQVLLNLLLNARDAVMERSDGARSIVLGARRDPAGVDGVEITVEDNGIGVPAALRERIFDPFFTTKPPGLGTGLGLSSALGTVRAHGGDLTCESDPGVGTRFVVRLPLEQGPASPEHPAPTSGRRRVVVADDEPLVLRAVGRVLERAGCDVRLAASAVELQQCLLGAPPQLVIVDLSVLAPSPAEALSDLRARASTAKLVLFTGAAGQGFESLVDAVLEKPVLPQRLVQLTEGL